MHPTAERDRPSAWRGAVLGMLAVVAAAVAIGIVGLALAAAAASIA